MIKLANLHSFLQDLNLVPAEQIYSTADDIKIIPSGRLTSTAGEIVIAEKHYTAVYTIERYKDRVLSEDLIIAHLSAWLLDNDTDRTESITFDLIADKEDHDCSTLEFSIPFVELVTLVEDVDGPITHDGTTYSLA